MASRTKLLSQQDFNLLSGEGGLGRVGPLDSAVALVSGEIMALLDINLPNRDQSVKSRWRINCVPAATALIAGLPLVHNNADNFEPIRSAIERSPQRFPKLGPSN
jgi:predicted nucleic acid-binding protein